MTITDRTKSSQFQYLQRHSTVLDYLMFGIWLFSPPVTPSLSLFVRQSCHNDCDGGTVPIIRVSPSLYMEYSHIALKLKSAVLSLTRCEWEQSNEKTFIQQDKRNFPLHPRMLSLHIPDTHHHFLPFNHQFHHDHDHIVIIFKEWRMQIGIIWRLPPQLSRL